MKINIVHLGFADYKDALELQESLHVQIKEEALDDTLLLLEHPPVLTLGTRGDHTNIYLSQEDLEKKGVSVYEVGRGGDVTYHGPGQIVGYPILNLNRHGKDIHDFVFKIQEVFIRLLGEEYKLNAHREDSKYTGVWVENEKITAIGIAVRHWTSMHGFAFNINTDLSHFSWINPCGLTDRSVTSLEKLTGYKHDLQKLNHQVAGYFCDVFGMEGNTCLVKDLIG